MAAIPLPRSTPLHLIGLRRSRFCVGEAVSCLKHKTAAHAGCSCSAGELESHKTLGAAALSLKGVKNLGEEKNPFFWRGLQYLGLSPPSRNGSGFGFEVALEHLLSTAGRPVLEAVPRCPAFCFPPGDLPGGGGCPAGG